MPMYDMAFIVIFFDKMSVIPVVTRKNDLKKLF
jgi:hypothetical protein